MSKVVSVAGVLPMAKVTIYVDGQKGYTGDLPIDNWIEIGIGLKPGQLVTASQNYMGEESGQSLTPVVVSPDPKSLPVPEFALPTNNFTTLVSIGRLEIGTEVTIKRADNGTVVGHDIAQKQTQFFKLDPSVSIASAENLSVGQKFDGMDSGDGLSAKLLRIDDVTKILPPLQLFPNELLACSTSVSFAQAIPGLEVRVENEGKVTTFLSGEVNYTVDDCQPLSVGKLIATHSVPRIDLVSEPAVADVTKIPEMLAPAIIAPYCPSLGKISVATTAGAVIHIVAQVGANGAWTEVGMVFANHSADSYDLPFALLPQGATALAAFVDFCGAISPQSAPVGIGGVEPSPQARIEEPLFQCSQYIKLTGLARGTLVHIEDKDGIQLLGGKVALGDWMIAKLEHVLDLEQHRVVIVTLTHCSGTQTLTAEVQKLPEHQLEILPIRPGDSMMRIKGALQGSRVDIYRNDVFVTSGITFGDPAQYWLGGVAREREVWSATESLCAGRWDAHGVVVTRAKLDIITPPQVRAGMLQKFTIHAKDTDTGEDVTNGNLRVKTDVDTQDFPITTELAYNLPADRTAPLTGTVFGLDRYETATFSIPVVPNTPPPPPAGKTFRIEIGPQDFTSVLAVGGDYNIHNVIINGTLRVNSVKVLVTPQGGVAKTLDMTLGGNQVFAAETDLGDYQGLVNLEFDFTVSYDFNIDQTWGFLTSNEVQKITIQRVDTVQSPGYAYLPLQFSWPDTHNALHFLISPVAQPKKVGAMDNKVVLDVVFQPEFP